MTVSLPVGFEAALLHRDAGQTRGLDAGAASASAARTAAEAFEAQFVTQMLGHMFTGISTDGPFGGGRAEEIWQSQMIEQYGRQIAESGGIGIADQVLAEMLRMQETAQ